LGRREITPTFKKKTRLFSLAQWHSEDPPAGR